jgi:ADP-ribose pyrophosphatase
MKIISKEEVYKAKYFRVSKITLERNGKTFTKEFIERNSTVVIIPYTSENEIYIESQFRDALNRVTLEAVAGQIEEGDDPLYTAKKELLEETGLTARTWHKLAEWDLSVNMKSKVHVFAAADLTQGEAKPDEDEEIEMIKMPLDEVIAKIENGELTGTSHIAALFLFKKMREEGKL